MDPLSARVIELVRELVKTPLEGIRMESRLIADLKLDGDDFAMTLVPELKREFSLKVARKEWEEVSTVADLIKVVRDHLPTPG